MSLHVSHPDYLRRPVHGGGREWRDDPRKSEHGEGSRGRRIRQAREGRSCRHRRHGTSATGRPRRPTNAGSTPSEAVSRAGYRHGQAEGFGPEFREVNVPKGGEVGALSSDWGSRAHSVSGSWTGPEARRRRICRSESGAGTTRCSGSGLNPRLPWRSTANAQTDAAGALHLDKCSERRDARSYF